MKTCKWCKHSVWRKRRNGKDDYSKPGLCKFGKYSSVEKAIGIVRDSHSCDKWEKRDAPAR